MSLADARCSVVNAQALSVAGSVTAGSVAAGSINADVVVPRIVYITSGAGGAAAIQSAVIPNLTAGANLFVQQISSGAPIIPVVADTYVPGAPGSGYVIRLTAAAPMAANADFNVYIARY